MECFPPCKTCTGLCQQVPPKPVRARSQSKREAAKKPVVPQRMTGYVVLVCGHYTTWEEQLRTPGFRKSRRRYWCDKCQHWGPAMTMTERIAKIKEEPLF